MDDRTLLEMAARAAGLWDDGYRAELRDGEGWICMRPADDKCPFVSVWAPLTDDGDALRLAAKLNMTVQFSNWCCSVMFGKAGSATEIAESTESKASTARRAIVRAAAEIGRTGTRE